ncbi:MAG: hypothetical protein V3W41_11365 [Planctomycetota bacterium]
MGTQVEFFIAAAQAIGADGESRCSLGASRKWQKVTRYAISQSLSDSLSFAWESRPQKPRTGFIALTGASPFGSLFFGVSLAPVNTTFTSNGIQFPLYISPAPGELFLTAPTVADQNGEFRFFEFLNRPNLAGIVLYYQVAETAPLESTSNGMELLFGL